MQTFLPEMSFALSAKVLDRQRLGKQRVEAKQIILALENPDYGWQNHPAVRMWREYPNTLAEYGAVICAEWRSRGYRDTLLDFFEVRTDVDIVYPPWLNEEFCRAHQSNLMRKLPAHYGRWYADVPADLPYIWPV